MKEILEKIIHKLKQKVVYPVPQESLEPPKREEAAKYRVRQTKEENALKKELCHDTA
ncbi:MAG: hypothetical protein ACE5PV_27665 [Candidatus Poribacteria bacterium]